MSCFGRGDGVCARVAVVMYLLIGGYALCDKQGEQNLYRESSNVEAGGTDKGQWGAERGTSGNARPRGRAVVAGGAGGAAGERASVGILKSFVGGGREDG